MGGSHVQAQSEVCAPSIQTFNVTLLAVICGAGIDAINPCEFAILILLMASMLATEPTQRKKALYTGFAFIAGIFIAYFLMGIGLMEFIRKYTLDFSSYFYNIIGILAIIMGLFNLKDYFWYGKVFLMEVPLSWRPKMKSLVRGISNPIGGFLIALLVSVFLLPCTAGPYVVILGMLAHKLTFYKALSYLILYNLIFILPMLAIILFIYYGLSPEKAEAWRKQKLRLLHLVAGVILVGLGIAILGKWI
jgi:cytochrome c biogenesis protein CcdA